MSAIVGGPSSQFSAYFVKTDQPRRSREREEKRERRKRKGGEGGIKGKGRGAVGEKGKEEGNWRRDTWGHPRLRDIRKTVEIILVCLTTAAPVIFNWRPTNVLTN